MKKILFILLIAGNSYAQKTTRITVSEYKSLIIIGSVTEQDTLFMMMGQNAKYEHIINTISIKSGNLNDINNLMNECLKFLPESEGTTLGYEGNTILAMGKNRLLLYGEGEDSDGYIMLNKSIISKLQTDIANFKK